MKMFGESVEKCAEVSVRCRTDAPVYVPFFHSPQVGPGDAGLSAGDAGNRMQFIELGRVFPVAGSRTARRAASSLGPPAPAGGRVCAGRRVDRVPIAPMTALKVEEWTG